MTQQEGVPSEKTGSTVAGIIPDFFHDIIAYIIPGYVVIFLIAFNAFLLGYVEPADSSFLAGLNWAIAIFAGGILTIIAYVIGRFFSELGHYTIHKLVGSPKWSLIFKRDSFYTDNFRENVKKKIQDWFDEQSWQAADGKSLMDECEDRKKDDYFNVIQYSLNERFSSFSLYNKKQNALVVSDRSLTIIFLLNPFLLSLAALDTPGLAALGMSFISIISALIFFERFKRDKEYYAMHTFETFIATRKPRGENKSENTSSSPRQTSNEKG